MTAAIALDDSQGMTLDEFQDWHPDGYERFELIEGRVVKVEPTGKHGKVSGEIRLDLGIEIRRLQQPYFLPNDCVVQPIDADKTGYRPDVIVLNDSAIQAEPLWERRSRITKGDSVILVAEVVSTNWRDDYLKKLADYEELGIPEYWIVDYLGLAATRHIGQGKPPTITVCQLVDGEYQLTLFRGDDRVLSRAFPELTLTANQIFQTPVATA